MSFDIANFVSPAALRVLKTAGLHKVAGVMAGINELTLKEAVAVIGAKARMRHVEGQKIADGLQALAALNGEKAANMWEPLLQRAIGPGLIGAGIAAAPELLQEGPVNQERLLERALLGGAIGGIGGMGTALHKAVKTNPGLGAQIGTSVGQLP